MRELSLKEIQKGELDILKRFSDICEKCNFSYFIAYGTLIGAVRHKGFIPWDDDVDVIMPREDYNKFLDYYKDNKSEFEFLELKNWKFDKNYVYPISRLSDSRYQVDYNYISDYGLGLFIDIYPFDGCGDTREQAIKLYRKTMALRASVALASNKKYIFSSKGKFRNLIKFPMYINAKIHGSLFYLKKLDRICQLTKYNESNYVYCMVWGSKIENAVEKKMFDEYIYVEFEKYKFRAPKDYDYWLRVMYGNYMELPPECDRIAHHNYRAYIKDEFINI